MDIARRKLVMEFLDNEGEFPIDKKSCSLLGPTALVVQALMGVLVILSLVYKRHREPLKRPWRVWMYDVSKQILGQAFVHAMNLVISDVGADHWKEGSNACVFYFFNVLIDTTLGVAVIYGLLHLINYVLVIRLQLKGFASGQYDSPPRLSYWARQAAVYVAVLTTMKLLVIALFAAWPGIFRVGEWLLSWTGNGGSLQVIFVMGVFPIIMNIIQFWIIDTIVKESVTLSSLRLAPAADEEARVPLFDGSNEDLVDEEPTLRRSSDLKSGEETKVQTPLADDTKSLSPRPPSASASTSS